VRENPARQVEIEPTLPNLPLTADIDTAVGVHATRDNLEFTVFHRDQNEIGDGRDAGFTQPPRRPLVSDLRHAPPSEPDTRADESYNNERDLIFRSQSADAVEVLGGLDSQAASSIGRLPG